MRCEYKSYVKIDIDNHYRTHTDEEPKFNLAKKEQEIRDLKEKLKQTLVEISESNPAQNIPEQCKRMTTKELSESTTGHSEDSIHSPYDYIEIFESRAIDIQRDASGFYQCDQC